MTVKIFRIFILAAFLSLMVFQSALAASGDKIRRIKIEGIERIEEATINSYIELESGDPFDPALLDRALKNLYQTGLFADVSLYQQGQDLVITVKENPIINEIAFEGNDKLKDEDLLAEIQLKPRNVFTRTKVQADVERLMEIYRLSGRFSATIEPKVIMLDQNRVNLVFEIVEGPVTYISRISFIGNKKFDDDQLQKAVRSKEDRWWRFLSSDDKYDPDRLAYDRELLRKFYLDHGYADFRVQSAVAELSPDRRNFYVTFTVEEGERYRIGNVHIQSNIPELSAAPYKESLTFKPGDWYKASDIEATVLKLTTAMGNQQYAFVDIVPGVTRNRDKRVVDIRFDLNEGQKAFVENININGNVRTLDEVIRREMLVMEGDPYNATKIKKSEQNIKDLGFFEKVEVRPEQASSPDKTNIDINVEEKSTGSLSLGAGYSSSDGPLGDFRIQEKNFLGKGQELQLSTTISGKRAEYDFSFTEPYFMRRDLSAGVDLFHTTRDLQEESSYDSRQTGGGLRLGYPLSEHWRQNLTYRFDTTDITDVKPTASTFIQLQEGKRTTSLIGQQLSYDTLDSRLDPTEGFIGKLSTELTGLGGDSQFARFKLGGTYYVPVYERWILSFLGETGYVFGWGDEDVRINERFYLGGDSLRGFADSGIGPRDGATDDALGGNRFWRGSVEMDFPSGLPDDLGVRAHVFSDFGSLTDLDDFGAGILDAGTVRASAGGGISWKSPLGPIRIDLGFPLIKEDEDEKEIFRFGFRTKF